MDRIGAKHVERRRQVQRGYRSRRAASQSRSAAAPPMEQKGSLAKSFELLKEAQQ
jgi:hypothetical protein